MGPFIYQSRKNGSVIYSFLGKRGVIVYLAALKKGAIRAAHPYHVIYRELPPEQLRSKTTTGVVVSNKRHLPEIHNSKFVNCSIGLSLIMKKKKTLLLLLLLLLLLSSSSVSF